MNRVATNELAETSGSISLAAPFSRICDNRAILALAVAALSLLLYLPVNHLLFVNYDDSGYLNYHVRMGLSWQNVKWAFGTVYYANWHPVTWLGHMLDCQWFGLNPAGHHLSNLLVHCLNAMLLFLVLENLTLNKARSFIVALLFAVHPLNVQSVAWISEKKNLLSTLFLFLAIGAYARYVRRPGTWRYLVVLLSFAIGLMAKPMIVTFPFVLLLLDYWPLQRFSLFQEGRSESPTTSGSTHAEQLTDDIPRFSFGWLLLEKAPFLLLSAADAVITVFAQKSMNAITDVDFSLLIRLENAAISYVSYILKMFWPTQLAVFYPHPGSSVSLRRAFFAFLFVFALTVIVIWKRNHKYLLTGWLFYLGTLVPVIGLVQVGSQAMADRYAYVPIIGLFIVLVWGVGDLLARSSRPSTNRIAAVATLCIVTSLAVDTRKQLAFWHDGITLFSHDLAVAPDNYIGHSKLAEALEASGRLDEALAEFRSYQAQHPDDAAANYNLSAALFRVGKTQEAVEGLKRTLTLTQVPTILSHTHWQLGNVLYTLGDMGAAEQQYRKAAALNSKEYGAYLALGLMLERQGKNEEAIRFLTECLNMEGPDSAYFHLGQAYEAEGRFSEALATYRQGLKIVPQSEEIQLAIKNIEQKSAQPQRQP